MRLYAFIVLATCVLVEAGSFLLLLVMQTFQTGDTASSVQVLLSLHPWAHQQVAYGAFDPVTTQRYVLNSKTGVLRINGHGFIANNSGVPNLETFPEKLVGTTRIFLLGGSSLAGNALRSDNSHTIASYLERNLNLNSPPGRAFQVLNYGMSGAWTFSELRKFFAEIIHLEPDIVVNLDGWNDAVYSRFEADRNDVSQGLVNWDQLSYLYFNRFNGVDRGRRKPPPVFTYVFLLLDGFGLFEARDAQARADLYASHHLTGLSAFLEARHNGLDFAFTRNLEAISAYCAANGIRHIAYLQPYAEHKRPALAEEQKILDAYHALAAAQNGELWVRHRYRTLLAGIYDRFQAAFATYAAKYADQPLVTAFDLTALFEDVGEVIYLDSIHYNERGNKILADRMADDIREHEIAKP